MVLATLYLELLKKTEAFMKTKLVLWGTREPEARVLLGLELRAQDNMVDVYVFPDEVVTEAFNQKMMQDWRDGVAVEFPERVEKFEMELSVSNPILPDGLKPEREDLVQRAQTEWHFIVLSSKLYQAYQSELEEIKDKIDQLEAFDNKHWDSLKQFWSKVQGQVRERNLFKEHADALRDNTNALFAHLKNLRSKLDEAFKQTSQKEHDNFLGLIAEIEERINAGKRLQPIFEELKGLQRKFRDTKFTRDHRSKVWEKLDATFKLVKQKRFGAKADDRSPLERINRRFEGLISAIEKMERSISRDEGDLSFQQKKIQRTDGQLEAQIRQAKILMIEERIRSKQEKLKEMQQTKAELEKRIEGLREKEAKRLEQQKIEEAKKLAEQKIAEEIKEAAQKREDNSEKLEKAASAITGKEDSENEGEQQPEKTMEADEEMVVSAKDMATEAVDKVVSLAKEATADLLSKNAEEKPEEKVEVPEDQGQKEGEAEVVESESDQAVK